MSDVELKYGSTGFEKVEKELASLEKQAGGSASWFKPMQTSLKDAETAGTSFFSKFNVHLGSLKFGINDLVSSIAKIGVVITSVAAIVGGVATYAFGKWTSGLLKSTESVRMLEISLYGATKSWDTVGKITKFAKEYAEEYPAMFKDVMQTMQSFAYIPAFKPLIQQADVKFMKEAMDIVQALSTMRPEQGVQGAVFALREALAGNWRSLQMRFDVPVESIARSAGMTMEQMKESPMTGFKGLGAFTKEFVGIDTMAMMAKNLGVQMGNLKEKYDNWLVAIGKTGIYDKVINYLLQLNDWFSKIAQSEKIQKITTQINAFLEGIVDRIAGIFTKGIDWSNIMSLGGLLEAIKQIGTNLIEGLKSVWENVKEPLGITVKETFKFLGKAAFFAFKEGLIEGMKDQLKEVGETFKTWDEKLREKMGVLNEPPMKAPEIGEWKGPRPWQKEPLSPVGLLYTGIGYQPTKPLASVPAKSAEEEFQRFSMWSKMASQLAQAPREEPRGWWSSVAGQYATGKFGYEEYLKRKKVEDFQGMQMGKLSEIAEMPGAGADLRTKLYEQMFTVSMGRGEYGKAETYMNKALDEMVRGMQEEKGRSEQSVKSLLNIETNTKVIADNSNKPDQGGQTITNAPVTSIQNIYQSETTVVHDEIRTIVREAAGEGGAGRGC